MPSVGAALKQESFGQTQRPDAWWVAPLTTFLVFSGFVVYATWAGLQGNNYHLGNYLSPFYSPEIFGTSPHAWIQAERPSFWPTWLIFSPAMLIVWAPLGFRFTCYYYRGSYYKAFWADPPNCAVGEPRKSYLGENSLPLILQNIHRYFAYIAMIFVVILAHDAWKGFWFGDEATGQRFGIGVGSIVLTLNVVFIACYTFGCHSIRHLICGYKDHFSSAPLRAKSYACVSCLNRRHMNWAWTSLFFVGFTDLYIRLCAMGIWKDFHIVF